MTLDEFKKTNLGEKMKKTKGVLIVLETLLLCSYASAEIINIPAEQSTIQLGIDVAAVGDTVLVQPGTYVENIDYSGKNITVGSLFLTTQDTVFISQTIINGNEAGHVVEFTNGESADAILTGFTITNGYDVSGGGIFITYAHPSLTNLIITENSTSGQNFGDGGGGIFLDHSHPNITNVTLSGNSTWKGGGIACTHWSSPALNDVTIYENSAAWGGGIFCYDNSSPIIDNSIISNNCGGYGGGVHCYNVSCPTLNNVSIIDNDSGGYGGGMYVYWSCPVLNNVIISRNNADRGGGLNCWQGSYPSLSNVTISENTASTRGGGLYFEASSWPNFSSTDRCNIYLNYAGVGCDFYTAGCYINVVVDTFTVLQPDNHFAHSFSNFSFDILNCKVEQVNEDLYVNPTGSDNNSGLSADDPLQTISLALTKIIADETNPHTIYLSNGTYSPSQTGERFSLNCRSYVSLQGEQEELTILDAEGQSAVICGWGDNNFSIKDITVRNGHTPVYGGGIFLTGSSPDLNNITIEECSAVVGGGGINFENSASIVTNLTVSGNTAPSGGGIRCLHADDLYLRNVIIKGNTADDNGGGIACYESDPTLINATMSNNTAVQDGGAICCLLNSNPILLNCILWDDLPQEISFYSEFNPNSITISYSDIQGGQNGIQTNNNGTVYWLDGNINADPLFVNQAIDDYHLTGNSPCIDAGIPDTTGLNLPEYDYDGNPRIYNGIIDMGVYEWQGVSVIEDYTASVTIGMAPLTVQFPNPFRIQSSVEFTLQAPCHVKLSIYDICGRLVEDVLDSELPAGDHTCTVGRDRIPGGVYFLRFQAGEQVETGRFVVLE